MRKELLGALLAVVLIVVLPSAARATCIASCSTAKVVDVHCADAEEKQKAGPVYFVADCDFYCDPNMGPEYITRDKLGAEDFHVLETTDAGGIYPDLSNVLPATIVRDGACGAVSRFRLDAELQPGTSYTIVAEYIEVVSFETASADEFEDVGCSVGRRGPGGALPLLLLALGALVAPACRRRGTR